MVTLKEEEEHEFMTGMRNEEEKEVLPTVCLCGDIISRVVVPPWHQLEAT